MVQVKINNSIERDHRNQIIKITRQWIGTPYHHQQSTKQVGCDCLGLVRGVYEQLYKTPTAKHPSYSRDWADVTKQETLINAAANHLQKVALGKYHPGDVVIFRFRQWMVAKHTAILVSPTTMIHAIEGAPVCEVHMGKWWCRHMAAAFSFPLKPKQIR